ncbi:MAG TPA: tripartite tricarboxylate transporter substrate-binding protein [Burkholderiales bacterium]|jgi:tripartite-type tricarboxylate transporter receptor subunit TctC|nr:tripartite tricarboxylate transporter substrate-binding protein [Burkholderiales bacterium]
MKTTIGLLAGAACALITGAAAAQGYPGGRPVTLEVPFAAGGPTDIVARQLAQAMTKPLGTTVIVDNKPGAGGTIASEFVAKAPPDGYTLLLHHIGMATSPALYRQLRFNPLTDYEYIGQVVNVPMTLVARPTFPANNMKELVAYVKANAKKVNLANAGLGAASHLCGLLFQTAIQTEVQTIPYKGTAPAMTDLQGGQVDLLCDQTTQTTQLIQTKRVKAYGATTAKRISSLPDLPTMAEQGYPQFEVVIWHGVYAPKGTPKPVVDALVKALQAAVKDPGFHSAMDKLGTVAVADADVTPEGLRNHLKAEIDKWTPIIKKAGQYAD